MKNKILYLGLALAASSLLNSLFAQVTQEAVDSLTSSKSLLDEIKEAATASKLSIENYINNPSEREKALRDPDVEVVRISEHFEAHKEDNYLENIVQNGFLKGLVVKTGGGALAMTAVLSYAAPNDKNKFLARLAKKGIRIAARFGGTYFITDGVSAFIVTLNARDPSPTAVPGALGYLLRQTEETAKEMPAIIKRLPTHVSKSFQGKINEQE